MVKFGSVRLRSFAGELDQFPFPAAQNVGAMAGSDGIKGTFRKLRFSGNRSPDIGTIPFQVPSGIVSGALPGWKTRELPSPIGELTS